MMAHETEKTAEAANADAKRPVQRFVMPLSRYGLEWRGPKEFIPAEMSDGYWTPWHLAQEAIDALKIEVEVQSYWGPKWEAEHAEVLRLRKIIDDAGKAV
jgi:hypothetical protein